MEKPPNQPMAASTSSLPAQTMDPTTLIDPTDTTLNAQSSRFELELEFIQSLANSDYLRFLAQNQFFQNEKFVRYLEYLQYWRDPKYARFLMYVFIFEHCSGLPVASWLSIICCMYMIWMSKKSGLTMMVTNFTLRRCSL